MKRTVTLLAFGLITAGAVSVPPVEAAGRKITSETAGYRCSANTAPAGAWVGWFQGYTESPMIISGDSVMMVSRTRCFESETECRDWTYTMTSKYSSGAMRQRCEAR